MFWLNAGVSDWLLLPPSAQLPGQAACFDAAASESLRGCSPLFLTAVPDPARGRSGPGLLRRSARLQEVWEIASPAQLRDAQLDRADPGLPVAITVAVAPVGAIGAALAVPGAALL